MTIEFVRSYEKGLSTFLPKGANDRIAKLLKRPNTSVSLILTAGQWEDDEVVTAAIEEIKTDVERKQNLLTQWEIFKTGDKEAIFNSKCVCV